MTPRPRPCACGRAQALWDLFLPPVCLLCVPAAYARLGRPLTDAEWLRVSHLISRLVNEDQGRWWGLCALVEQLEMGLVEGVR